MAHPCTIHLVSLNDSKPSDLTPIITDIQCNDLAGFPIRGIPCGWAHKPHRIDKEALTSKKWDLFFLTQRSELVFSEDVQQFIETHLRIPAEISNEQFEALEARAERSGTNGLSEGDRPRANPRTPKLPQGWNGEIPSSAIVETRSDDLRVGELYLDSKMANLLSTAESPNIRGSPLCFFNLFKYTNNDRSVHDSYMNGFKERFGPDAGADIKFMGSVRGPLSDGGGDRDGVQWDDTNLVQYDSVWHYAYMLSTEVYQELNREKMRGLEDTCILMVSEVGWEDRVRS